MRTKTKNSIMAVIVSIIAIFVPAIILGKIIESIIFFFCHWFIREQYPKQYHHIIPSMCRLITSLVFFFGVTSVLPLPYSILSAIPICYFISWIGYTKKRSEDLELLCEKLQQTTYDKPILQPLIVDSCSEEILLQRCKQVNLTKYATELAIDCFIHKISTKELANKYCITPQSVRMQKTRIKDKLMLK